MSNGTRPIDESSAKSIVQLSHSDTVDFTVRPRGIIVKTDGIIVFVNDDDTTTTIPANVLAVGMLYALSPKRINATTSTAVVYGVY